MNWIGSIGKFSVALFNEQESGCPSFFVGIPRIAGIADCRTLNVQSKANAAEARAFVKKGAPRVRPVFEMLIVSCTV